MNGKVAGPTVDIEYPSGDGKPMAETDDHRITMVESIEIASDHLGDDPLAYVSGNMLMYYEPGNKRKHVSPDVFVVKGVPKGRRLNFLIWQEGKAPDLILEITSPSTRNEDQDDKFALYQNVLKVPEYVLFDPLAEYLEPPLQGYRLVGGLYEPIALVSGRLPSAVLGLHLEKEGTRLRYWNPATQTHLLTRGERADTEQHWRQQAETARQQAEAARQQAEAARNDEAAARRLAEEERDRLRREIEELRLRLGREPQRP